MALTTLKVPTELRDRIAGDARNEHKTIAAFLADLVDQWERSQREASLAAAIAANPPDQQYWTEFSEFAALEAELPDPELPNG